MRRFPHVIIVLFGTFYFSSSPCRAIEIKFAGRDSSVDVSSLQIKKSVFLNSRAVEAKLPVIIRRDVDAGLRAICSEVNCVPIFAMDPEEFQIRDSVEYIVAEQVVKAMGYQARITKTEITLTCDDVCARARIGTAEGARAPGFRLPARTGSIVSLNDLRKEGAVVIAFVRSLEWDPFSQQLVRILQSKMDSLRAANVNVVAIHGYGKEQNGVWQDTLRLTFPLLADEASAVTRGYDVFDLGSLPHPAVFVVDASGVIRLRKVFEELNVSPDISPIMEVISRLSQP